MDSSVRAAFPTQVWDAESKYVERPELDRSLAAALDDGGPGAIIIGPPGTGKTIALAHRLRIGVDRGPVLAHVCSRRYLGTRVDPHGFARNLSDQLKVLREGAASSAPLGGTVLHGTVKAETNNGLAVGVIQFLSSLQDKFEREVMGPLGVLAMRANRPLLIIDGLDEAAPVREGPDITDLLCDQLASLAGQVAIVITAATGSQAAGRVRAAFPQLPLIDVAADPVETARALEKFAQLRGATGEQAGQIATQAGGNFVVASEILRARPPEAGSVVYATTLKERYRGVLARISGDDSRVWSRDVALLQLACIAYEPIDLSVCQNVLELTTPELSASLSRLGEVVEVADRKLRLRHAIVRDAVYGIDHRNSWVIPEPDMHKVLVEQVVAQRLWTDYLAKYLHEHLRAAIGLRVSSAATLEFVRHLLGIQSLWGAVGTSPAVYVREALRSGVDVNRSRNACVALSHEVIVSEYLPLGIVSTAMQTALNLPWRDLRSVVRETLKWGSIQPLTGLCIAIASVPGQLPPTLIGEVVKNATTAQRHTVSVVLSAMWASQRNQQLGQKLEASLSATRATNLPLMKRVVSLVADVCILSYVQRPTDELLMTWISEVFEALFHDRRLLKSAVLAVNASERLRGIFGKHLAQQVFSALEETVGKVFVEGDPGRYVTAAALDDYLFLLSRGPLNGQLARIYELLDSPHPVENLLGAQAVSVHALTSGLSITAGDPHLSDWGLRWVIGSTAITWARPQMRTVEWFDAVLRRLEPSRGKWPVVVGAGPGSVNPMLLGWGLALADEGTRVEQVDQFLARHPHFRRDLLDGLLSASVYVPEYVGSTLSALAERDVVSDKELRDCSRFLNLLSPTGEWDDVQARLWTAPAIADMEMLYRTLLMIGHFNNGVSEAVNFPKMARGFLWPVYQLALGGLDERAAHSKYAAATLAMLVESDFRMLNWISEE